MKDENNLEKISEIKSRFNYWSGNNSEESVYKGTSCGHCGDSCHGDGSCGGDGS